MKSAKSLLTKSKESLANLQAFNNKAWDIFILVLGLIFFCFTPPKYLHWCTEQRKPQNDHDTMAVSSVLKPWGCMPTTDWKWPQGLVTFWTRATNCFGKSLLTWTKITLVPFLRAQAILFECKEMLFGIALLTPTFTTSVNSSGFE